MQIIKKLYFEFNRSTSILFTGSFLNTASPHSRDNPRDVDVIFVCFPVSSGTLISSEDDIKSTPRVNANAFRADSKVRVMF